MVSQVEGILSQRRYLTGNTITEADVRLYVTLVRFDAVYVGHFKVRSTTWLYSVILNRGESGGVGHDVITRTILHNLIEFQ